MMKYSWSSRFWNRSVSCLFYRVLIERIRSRFFDDSYSCVVLLIGRIFLIYNQSYFFCALYLMAFSNLNIFFKPLPRLYSKQSKIPRLRVSRYRPRIHQTSLFLEYHKSWGFIFGKNYHRFNLRLQTISFFGRIFPPNASSITVCLLYRIYSLHSDLIENINRANFVRGSARKSTRYSRL